MPRQASIPLNGAAPDVRLQVLSQPRYLCAAREMVSAVARRIGFDDLACSQIALAIDEALANVMRHGYANRPDGVIWVSLWPIGRGEAEKAAQARRLAGSGGDAGASNAMRRRGDGAGETGRQEHGGKRRKEEEDGGCGGGSATSAEREDAREDAGCGSCEGDAAAAGGGGIGAMRAGAASGASPGMGSMFPLGAPIGLRVVIEDEARQVDPEVIRSRDLDEIRPGGLGVHIIRHIMDEVRYEKRDGKGMRLTLEKRM